MLKQTSSTGRAVVRKGKQEGGAGSAGRDPLQLGSLLLLAVCIKAYIRSHMGKILTDLGSTFFS